MFAFSGIGVQSNIRVYTAFDLLSELGGYMQSIFAIALFVVSSYNTGCLKYNLVNKLRVLK